MTSLANHQSNDYVKLLLLGDAKSGKTGSLVSLVEAGYTLRILDLDNLLDFFKGQVLRHCPDRLSTVEFRTVRDKFKSSPAGMTIDGPPRAWIDSLKLLNRWKYTDDDGTDIDYGDPASWGPEVVLVIDSLSRWCDACFAFHEVMTPGGKSGDKDGRAVFFNAQKDIAKQLSFLTSKSMRTNVIVICHGIYQQRDDGRLKIFPRSVGQSQSPDIPTYFPNYIRYTNDNDKRTMQLVSDRMIDLSITRPDLLPDTLPVDTGLAKIFAALRQPSAAPEDKPSAVSLKRVR